MASTPSRGDVSRLASPVQNTVAAHTRRVFRLFEAVGKLETEFAAYWQNVATDQLCRFRLWAHTLGAQHEATSNKSADHRLRAVPDVRERILELLGEISEDFEDIGDILSGKRPGEVEEEDEANSPENSGPRYEISELWHMVENTVTSLMKISVLVRKSSARNRFDHAVKVSARANAPPIPTAWDIEHVRHKFPKLQGKPWLIKRLGETGTQRRAFLMYALGHEQRLAAGSASADGSKSVTSRPTEASTRATTVAPEKFDNTILQRLETYDGDDALSTGSATTYNTEGRNGNGATTLTVVPLDSVFVDGEPAICPYCRGMQLFKREKTWRRHVFYDLMAYSCTFEHCDQGPFGSRSVWASHERQCHLRSWRCPMCHHDFDDQSHVKKHLAAVHPSIDEALTVELIFAASHPIEHIPPSQCPFCDDCCLRQPVSRFFSSHENFQTLVPVALYQKHVSHHMQQLALFAVPSSTADSDDCGENSEQDSQSRSATDVPSKRHVTDHGHTTEHSVMNPETTLRSTPAESHNPSSPIMNPDETRDSGSTNSGALDGYGALTDLEGGHIDEFIDVGESETSEAEDQEILYQKTPDVYHGTKEKVYEEAEGSKAAKPHRPDLTICQEDEWAAKHSLSTPVEDDVTPSNLSVRLEGQAPASPADRLSAARESLRRQITLDKAMQRDEEEFEAAENQQLDHEANAVRNSRAFDTLKRRSDRPSVPMTIEWKGPGKKVYVTGSFVQWDRKFKLHRDKKGGFSTILQLEPGTHHLKFLVDGDMLTSHELPTTVDYTSILVNYIEVVAPLPEAAASHQSAQSRQPENTEVGMPP